MEDHIVDFDKPEDLVGIQVVHGYNLVEVGEEQHHIREEEAGKPAVELRNGCCYSHRCAIGMTVAGSYWTDSGWNS